MSFASKKGHLRQLKMVQSISRAGNDTIQTEEVRTPKKKKAPPANQFSSPSKHQKLDSSGNGTSSPFKRQKLYSFDIEPIIFNLDDGEVKKRQTLVRFISYYLNNVSDYLQDQNDYLRQFLDHEKSYLKHLLDQEVLPSNLACVTCGDRDAHFRCLDCYSPHWWCRPCVLKSHAWQPFH